MEVNQSAHFSSPRNVNLENDNTMIAIMLLFLLPCCLQFVLVCFLEHVKLRAGFQHEQQYSRQQQQQQQQQLLAEKQVQLIQQQQQQLQLFQQQPVRRMIQNFFFFYKNCNEIDKNVCFNFFL